LRIGLLSAAFAATFGWAAVSATAQTSGTPVTSPPALLAPEKQAIIKEHVNRTKVPATEMSGPVAVGTTVPKDVSLYSLPQDLMTEIPTVTSYRFLVSGHVIAVVEPESRRVIQIIQN